MARSISLPLTKAARWAAERNTIQVEYFVSTLRLYAPGAQQKPTTIGECDIGVVLGL